MLHTVAHANYSIRLIVVINYNVNMTNFLMRAVFSLSGRTLKEFEVLTLKPCECDFYLFLCNMNDYHLVR